MRENIGLFRAKHRRTKTWVYGSLILQDNNEPRIIGRYDKAVANPIIPETICECVGLKDKNGKLIFENDEIYFLDGMSIENGFDDFNNTGFVKWSEEEARFYVTDRESVDSEDALNYCTIIGNEFDNKVGD